MPFRGLTPLAACVAACFTLAACQDAPQSTTPVQHASLRATHVDRGDRIDTFRVHEIDGLSFGWGNGEPTEKDNHDGVAELVAGRPVRIDLEGRTHYRNATKNLFWTTMLVEGRVSFVPAADAHYVVHGELGDTESAVWIEDERTHEVVAGSRFTAPHPSIVPPDAASAP